MNEKECEEKVLGNWRRKKSMPWIPEAQEEQGLGSRNLSQFMVGSDRIGAWVSQRPGDWWQQPCEPWSSSLWPNLLKAKRSLDSATGCKWVHGFRIKAKTTREDQVWGSQARWQSYLQSSQEPPPFLQDQKMGKAPTHIDCIRFLLILGKKGLQPDFYLSKNKSKINFSHTSITSSRLQRN